MNRRNFLGSSAMLAAGAVAGIRSKVKTHGPVDMSVVLWTPFTVPCILSSDEDRNQFHVLIQVKDVPEIHAEMKLSQIRAAVRGDWGVMPVRTWNKFGEGNAKIRAWVDRGNVNFFPFDETIDQTAPIKLRLEDVRRVL